jgi:hypothetical protein
MQNAENNCKLSEVNTIELLNTLFIFSILFQHHIDYTINYFSYFTSFHIMAFLQKLSVGCFFFLSGFKLSVSNISVTPYTFIVNRFFRIYLLYLAALFVSSITAYPYSNMGEMPSWPNVILHILCVQSIFPNMFQTNYLTLWFVSTLFLFYIVFLMTRTVLHRSLLFCICIFLISLFVFFTYEYGKHIGIELFDRYFVLYLAIFASGMAYSRFDKNIHNINNMSLCILFITGFTGLIMSYNYVTIKIVYESTTEFIFTLMSTISVYILAFKLIPRLMLPHAVSNCVSWLSYSSFCVFLFHRVIWSEMSAIWNERIFAQWLFIIVLGIPTIFMLCHLTQRTYDLLTGTLRISRIPGYLK